MCPLAKFFPLTSGVSLEQINCVSTATLLSCVLGNDKQLLLL